MMPGILAEIKIQANLSHCRDSSEFKSRHFKIHAKEELSLSNVRRHNISVGRVSAFLPGGCGFDHRPSHTKYIENDTRYSIK